MYIILSCTAGEYAFDFATVFFAVCRHSPVALKEGTHAPFRDRVHSKEGRISEDIPLLLFDDVLFPRRLQYHFMSDCSLYQYTRVPGFRLYSQNESMDLHDGDDVYFSSHLFSNIYTSTKEIKDEEMQNDRAQREVGECTDET